MVLYSGMNIKPLYRFLCQDYTTVNSEIYKGAKRRKKLIEYVCGTFSIGLLEVIDTRNITGVQLYKKMDEYKSS